MQPIYTVIQVYRAIWKRGHASHLRPAIGTMSRNTILSSAYHCLEPKKGRGTKNLLLRTDISIFCKHH
jgi:hypothetical protein